MHREQSKLEDVADEISTYINMINSTDYEPLKEIYRNDIMRVIESHFQSIEECFTRFRRPTKMDVMLSPILEWEQCRIPIRKRKEYGRYKKGLELLQSETKYFGIKADDPDTPFTLHGVLVWFLNPTVTIECAWLEKLASYFDMVEIVRDGDWLFTSTLYTEGGYNG